MAGLEGGVREPDEVGPQGHVQGQDEAGGAKARPRRSFPSPSRLLLLPKGGSTQVGWILDFNNDGIVTAGELDDAVSILENPEEGLKNQKPIEKDEL